MIRIAISAEAFDAIAAVLPSGNVLYERERTGPRDEDLSAVIVRLFGEQANAQIAELLHGEQGPSEKGGK